MNENSILEAVRIIRESSTQYEPEEISIDEADGRVLAEDVICQFDIPGFNRSLMDGFAVLSRDTQSAAPDSPVVLQIAGTIPMGYGKTPQHRSGETWRVSTGGRIPDGADAVAMHEEVHGSVDPDAEDKTISITQPIFSGVNFVQRGHDFREGSVIFPKGWPIRIQDLGVLAAIGRTRVKVWRVPVVGIISTGREIISATLEPRDGEVREVNSYLISGFLRRQGVMSKVFGVIKDDPALFSVLLHQSASVCDMVIVSGGSAKSAHDITNEVINHLADPAQVEIMTGVGRPMVIRFIHGKPVIALPGHPTSAFLILVLGVTQLIQGLKGSPCQKQYKQSVQMAGDLPSRKDREQFFPVRIRDGKATSVGGVSGSFQTLLDSDGIIKVPVGTDLVMEGEEVEVIVW
jgi:molybdopterin molybdotransferase